MNFFQSSSHTEFAKINEKLDLIMDSLKLDRNKPPKDKSYNNRKNESLNTDVKKAKQLAKMLEYDERIRSKYYRDFDEYNNVSCDIPCNTGLGPELSHYGYVYGDWVLRRIKYIAKGTTKEEEKKLYEKQYKYLDMTRDEAEDFVDKYLKK